MKQLRSAALALMMVAAQGSLSAGRVGDTSGNLILKNVTQAKGTTTNPQTTSSVYAVVPELTLTVTTKGNQVLVIFSCSVFVAAGSAEWGVSFAIFKDGSQLSGDYAFQARQDASQQSLATATAQYLDAPTAASHTYDVRWKALFTTAVTATGTDRSIQLTELG